MLQHESASLAPVLPCAVQNLCGTALSDRISRIFRLRLWGEYACFTRPELKVERVSYPMMTPSAARGALESILWKPQICWCIERIDRLRVPIFQQVRRNEVELKASAERTAIVIDQVRQQRAALILRDVDYVVHARICLTPKAGQQDSLAKYSAMFQRRARAGQCFQRPYCKDPRIRRRVFAD